MTDDHCSGNDLNGGRLASRTDLLGRVSAPQRKLALVTAHVFIVHRMVSRKVGGSRGACGGAHATGEGNVPYSRGVAK